MWTIVRRARVFGVFFFNDTATTEIYTLSLHDALPIYPTQKPMELTKKLILSKINGSGNVLIPFSGSGSECVVAKSLGVPFLGIDINPIYVDFGKSWLKQ